VYGCLAVLVFLLIGRVPTILLLCFLGLLYLTWVELRAEPDLLPQVKLWWWLLVFITNLVGYFALRAWVWRRRRRRDAAAA
jgi:hypothetical protein